MKPWTIHRGDVRDVARERESGCEELPKGAKGADGREEERYVAIARARIQRGGVFSKLDKGKS